MKMKNSYSIAQRNSLVDKHLWCIDYVIGKNHYIYKAAKMEYDDVYQQLAIRLIKAVAGYNPSKSTLTRHILAQLKYELLNLKNARDICGITNVPSNFDRNNVISMSDFDEGSEQNILLAA